MCSSEHLKIVQDYSEHADTIRKLVIAELDKCLNKKRLDKEELKRVVDIFRRFKYTDAKSFLDKKGL